MSSCHPDDVHQGGSSVLLYQMGGSQLITDFFKFFIKVLIPQRLCAVTGNEDSDQTASCWSATSDLCDEVQDRCVFRQSDGQR